MAEAGYSGTPLAKKLGLKDGMRAHLVRVPDTLRGVFEGLALKTRLVGPLDYVHVFETDRPRLGALFPKIAAALEDTGLAWISWPKKASKVVTTLDEGGARELGLGAGLVDVKVCAVDEVWSGLKFVRRVRDRKQ